MLEQAAEKLAPVEKGAQEEGEGEDNDLFGRARTTRMTWRSMVKWCLKNILKRH